MFWNAMMMVALLAAPGPVAVLDFELRDLSTGTGTSTVEERERTATLRPLLEEVLAEAGMALVSVDPQAQQRANAGFGYLFDHPDVAAALGREAGARWVVVGRLHKPSFLFVYLKARVVDAQSGRLVAEPVVEVKGQQGPGTRRGVVRLSEAITAAIGAADPP